MTRNPPFLLWPVIIIGRLAKLMLGLSWRLLAMVIGSLLILVGMLLGATVIGSVCGLPLIFVGLLLFVQGLVV